MADAVVDAHTQEQGRLLRAFHFGQDRPKDEWSSTGPRSLSPFVPCASARIAAVFSAARLTHEDVLWDLGCGDGRVLHQAAVQHGCRCVGLEIDRACVDEAQQRAAEQGALPAVLAAGDRHACDARVQEAVCAAIASLVFAQRENHYGAGAGSLAGSAAAR